MVKYNDKGTLNTCGQMQIVLGRYWLFLHPYQHPAYGGELKLNFSSYFLIDIPPKSGSINAI